MVIWYECTLIDYLRELVLLKHPSSGSFFIVDTCAAMRLILFPWFHHYNFLRHHGAARCRLYDKDSPSSISEQSHWIMLQNWYSVFIFLTLASCFIYNLLCYNSRRTQQLSRFFELPNPSARINSTQRPAFTRFGIVQSTYGQNQFLCYRGLVRVRQFNHMPSWSEWSSLTYFFCQGSSMMFCLIARSIHCRWASSLLSLKVEINLHFRIHQQMATIGGLFDFSMKDITEIRSQHFCNYRIFKRGTAWTIKLISLADFPPPFGFHVCVRDRCMNFMLTQWYSMEMRNSLPDSVYSSENQTIHLNCSKLEL